MRLPNIKWSVGATIAAVSLVLSQPAEPQVAESGYSLPLSLAVDAATEAIRSCEGQSYAVSASVVDPTGVVKVQLKGDHSTIHTHDTSFRKAYTLVTFGPIFNLDTTSQIAELAKNPAGPGPALTSIPNVLALAWRRSDQTMKLWPPSPSAVRPVAPRTKPVPKQG